MGKKRIVVAVGGRFTAEKMSLALSAAGHEVHLITSLPRRSFKQAKGFQLTSVLLPEIILRAGKTIGLEHPADHAKVVLFGQRVAQLVKRLKPDLFIGWSSFSLEALRLKENFRRVLVRESTQIETQYEILHHEYTSLGLKFPQRAWCVARECAEYNIADRILVPSKYAKATFLERGYPEEKVQSLLLGVDVSRFQPLAMRKLTAPLRILSFGTIGVRKGTHHLLEATKDLDPDVFQVTLIGSIEAGYEPILKKYSHVTHLSAVPQTELARLIRDYDVFAFPSIEDGYGLVLPEAMASGLVPIATDRCGAAEILQDGINGLRVQAADPQALKKAIVKLWEDRANFSLMRERAIESAKLIRWEAYDEGLRALVRNDFLTNVKSITAKAIAPQVGTF